MSNKQQELPLKVAYYIRVSTEDQVEKYGKDLQRSSMDLYIKSRGKLDDGITDEMPFAGERYVYIDEGISGTTPLEERPAFARLQEDIRNSKEGNRPFDAVAVYKIDRFARKLKILLEIIDFFNDFKVTFISTKETIDTSSSFGRAILGIVGVLAELEMETIKERTLAGREEAIKSGVIMGTNPPFGYIKDVNKRPVIQPDEAKIVQMIFEDFLNLNLPLQGICKELSNLYIESPSYFSTRNKKSKRDPLKKEDRYFWNANMIKDILTNEIYIGKLYYNKTNQGKPLPKSEWKLSNYKVPPIIDEGTFLRVQKLLERSSFKHRLTSENKDHIYILRGLLKCSSCYDTERDLKTGMQTWHGEPKKITRKDGSFTHSYMYKCRRKNEAKTNIKCTTIPLPSDQIEQYVVNRVKELLANPQAVYDYQKNLESTKKYLEKLKLQQTYLEKNLNGFNKRLENLSEQQKLDIISMQELITRRGEEIANKEVKEKELETIKLELSNATLSIGYIKSFEVFKEKYANALDDITKNRADIHRILGMLIDSIVIHSRDVTSEDVIAGKHTDNQKIPYRIDIKMKLPKEYMEAIKEEVFKNVADGETPRPLPPEELTDEDLKRIGKTREEYTKDYEETLVQTDFGDKKPQWWARRESNPHAPKNTTF